MAATNYHDSTDALRKELMDSSVFHSRNADRYFTEEDPSPEHKVAGAGSLMAASYSYTLAAILRFARDTFGEEVADGLAFEVDELLTNGDFDDLNGDL